jgi:tetratricopeptide (TPR) repeat protein
MSHMATTHEILEEGVQLHKAGKLPQAEERYRQVLRADPQQADALNLLGVIANQVGTFFRQALAVQPAEAEFHRNLAAAYKAVGNVPGAVFEYREALRCKPAMVDARIYLSDTLMEQGNFDEALSHSLEALRQKPDSALAYCTLGEMAVQGRYTFTEDDIKRMQALLDAGRQSMHDACMVHFTLAAYWEKQGAYDQAFGAYARANELKREVYRQSNKVFEPAKHRELIDNLIAVFTPEFFAGAKAIGADSAVPVFVVGMVRSGTSLVEQILASLPRVFGAGELKDIDQISSVLPQRLRSAASYPHCLVGADPAIVRALADLYLKRLAHLGGAEAIRVIDKMPHNYLHLGLIAALLPGARIIHCRRDTLDVCVSAYLQNFKWLPYAASLDDIGFYYRQYDRLMEHWRRVLPLPMLDVSYEELVAKQEAVSRQMVAFCGLDWDDRCLAFHKSERAVQTASKLQVRQPIYTRSVARWKRFEAHLAPLHAALAGAPTPPPQEQQTSAK